MAYQLYQTASFGSGKAGLVTVGYQLFNADGTANGSRITTSIRDLAGGQYGALISYPTAFRGVITWDSGETVNLFASHEVNPETGENTTSSIAAVLTAIAAIPTTIFAYLKTLIP